ncbi:MAG: hypothetical protein AB1333_00300 [Patescibacteria group bacterium]
MAESIVLTGKIAELVTNLANEDEIPIEEFLTKLIEREHNKRHTGVPYRGKEEFKCTRKKCFVKKERPQESED